MHSKIKVNSCDIVWNMRDQRYEALILAERDGLDTRIFIPNLSLAADPKRIRLAEKYESLLGILDYIDVCTTAASGGFPEEMKKALNKIHEVCKEVFKGDIE
jgi:hypothetical protein